MYMLTEWKLKDDCYYIIVVICHYMTNGNFLESFSRLCIYTYTHTHTIYMYVNFMATSDSIKFSLKKKSVLDNFLVFKND